MTVNIFLSYAHQDQALQEELIKHLSGLRKKGRMNHWSASQISGGLNQKAEILDHLNKAHIVLLLISPDFFASNSCCDIEMPQALARHKENQARVIPVLLRPFHLEHTSLAQLKALPTQGTAITLWPDRDDAFVDVVEGIAQVIEELQNEVSHSEHTDAPPSPQQADNQQTLSALPPAPIPALSVQNFIGSISGNNHSIIQAGTQHTTTTNHYLSNPAAATRRVSYKKNRKSRKED